LASIGWLVSIDFSSFWLDCFEQKGALLVVVILE